MPGSGAAHYEAMPDGAVICRLCPRECRIPEGKTGFCRARQNLDRVLTSTNYGLLSALALDPIEKKPLYHFYPGKPVLSVGTVGCNLACEFCQNWRISRETAPTRRITPAELVDLAETARNERGSVGLAYTYSEPLVWYEFIMDTAPLIRERGLKNILVTNAFLQPGPWREILRWIDAANIDLKGFRPEYYRRLCHGELQPVLDNIQSAVGRIHLELTTLIIPGANDAPAEIEALAKWVAALDPETPLHLSRCFPNYKLSKAATPMETMERAFAAARKYLKFVYLGNVGRHGDTVCPECGAIWVGRRGYTVTVAARERCPGCNRKITITLED